MADYSVIKGCLDPAWILGGILGKSVAMCRDPLSTACGVINSKHDDVVDTATTRNFSEHLEDSYFDPFHNFAENKNGYSHHFQDPVPDVCATQTIFTGLPSLASSETFS